MRFFSRVGGLPEGLHRDSGPKKVSDGSRVSPFKGLRDVMIPRLQDPACVYKSVVDHHLPARAGTDLDSVSRRTELAARWRGTPVVISPAHYGVVGSDPT